MLNLTHFNCESQKVLLWTADRYMHTCTHSCSVVYTCTYVRMYIVSCMLMQNEITSRDVVKVIQGPNIVSSIDLP